MVTLKKLQCWHFNSDRPLFIACAFRVFATDLPWDYLKVSGEDKIVKLFLLFCQYIFFLTAMSSWIYCFEMSFLIFLCIWTKLQCHILRRLPTLYLVWYHHLKIYTSVKTTHLIFLRKYFKISLGYIVRIVMVWKNENFILDLICELNGDAIDLEGSDHKAGW